MKALKTLLALGFATVLVGCGNRLPTQGGNGGAAGILEVMVEQGGMGVAGANVQVLDPNGAPFQDAQADENGVATFDGLPAASGYTVSAEYDGATGKQTGVSVAPSDKTLVRVALGFGSGPGGIIAGSVKIASNGFGIAGAVVEVLGTQIKATTDHSGYYKFENVPAGAQKIQASAAGYRTGLREVTVKAGASHPANFDLYGNTDGTSAGNTLVTTAARLVEFDQWHNPIAESKTGAAWSATFDRVSGTVLLADAGKNAVIETTIRGSVIKTYNATAFWKLGIGGLKAPRGAVRTKNSTLLVADTGNNRIIEIDSADKKVWAYETKLNQPRWAERLPNGNTLIADSGNNRVIEVNAGGRIVWGLGDGSRNVINFPTHVQRLANGNTLVTDAGNSRVLEVNPQGGLVWMVGLQRPMAGDDKGLRNPNSAVRLANGNTLIADTGNHRVVEVDTKSNVVFQQPIASPLFADRM
jgi:hypothetical protein